METSLFVFTSGVLPGVSQAGGSLSGIPILAVVNVIEVQAGFPGGQAEVDAFTNMFSQVPEPGLMILIGLGVTGLIARRKKELRTKN
jgi:hypothetical protein